MMSTGFSESSWRGSSWRAAFIFAVVLLLHAWALYIFARGLSAFVPADVTQTTLSVSLLAPPPAPAAVAQPAPRPRARNAPTIPPATPIPAPAPAPPPDAAAPDVPPAPSQIAAVPPAASTAQTPGLPLGVQALPTKGRIAYRTTYTGLRGVTALVYVDWGLDLENARYELWLRTVDPPGLWDLRSSGSLKSFGIAPEAYLERLEIANREFRVDFDWPVSIARFTGRGARPPAQFLEGTQDPLSLQFHLPLLAQAYPWRFSPGSEVTFFVARRGVENYSFVVEGFEQLEVDGKDVMTLKIDRKRGADVKYGVEIWMAPEFQWLAVRLRFTDPGGEVWDSILAQVPSDPPPPDRIVQEPVKP